jgi:hypothetical protein
LQLRVIRIYGGEASARERVVRQADNEWQRGATRPALTEGERLAIWSLRQAVAGSRCCRAGRTRGIERDLAEMAAVFQDVFKPSDLGTPESLTLTKSERRLLHAAAVAQAEDAGLLDNYLYKLALDRDLRARLAGAVTTLAACLALQGHWLTRPAGCLPAAALTVARLHGWDMEALSVDWPPQKPLGRP